jgi:hypothetical protein
MAAPDYPDRAEWPRYWAGIRSAAAVFGGIVLGVVLLSLAEPWIESIGPPWEWLIDATVIFATTASLTRLLAPDRP